MIKKTFWLNCYHFDEKEWFITIWKVTVLIFRQKRYFLKYTNTNHSFINNFSFLSFLIEKTVEGVDCCFNSCYFLCLLIRNINSNVLLHCNNHFNRVQRIETQLFECCSFRKFWMITFCCTTKNFEHFCLNLLQKLSLFFICTEESTRLDCHE
jgi:hypothetical protein